MGFVSRGSRGPVPVFRSWYLIGVVMVIAAIAWGQQGVRQTKNVARGRVGLNHQADLILNSGEGRHILANGVDILARFASLEAMEDMIGALNNTVHIQAGHIASLNVILNAHAAIIDTLRANDIAHVATIDDLTNTIVTFAYTNTLMNSTLNTQAAIIDTLRANDIAYAAALGNLTNTIVHLKSASLWVNSTLNAQAAIIDTLRVNDTAQTDTIVNLTNTIAYLEGTQSVGSKPNRTIVLGNMNCSDAPIGLNLVNGVSSGFCDETWVQTVTGTWNTSI